jgi:VCBS repeat-containing protein
MAAGMALLLLVPTVLIASATSSPRALKLGCSQGVLRYAARAADCTGGRLVRFQQDYPVYVCRSRSAVRLIGGPAKCRRRETRVTLPGRASRWFCVRQKTHKLRMVRRRSDCSRGEFPVILPRHKPNHVPVAQADHTTTDDNAAKVVAVLSNDEDGDGDPLHVSSIDATRIKGSVVLNGDGTITYDPSGTFRTLKVGEAAAETFTYRVSDGKAESAPAPVRVAINGANEAPVAVDDTATTDSAHSRQIFVLANDRDLDGDPLSVASVDTSGTRGGATVNSNGAVLYSPNHQFDSLAKGQSAHDTFRYEVADAHGGTSIGTVDVTVTGTRAASAPVVTTSGGSTSYTEGAGAVALDPALTVSDADSADLASARIRFASGFQAGDQLVFADQAGISGAYDSDTGVLALTGHSSKANYQAALRSVGYRSGSNEAPVSSKRVEFTVSDGGLDSASVSKALTVTPVNDPPVVQTSAGQAAYTEGSTPVQADPGLNVTDPDSAQLMGARVAAGRGFSAADGDRLAFANQNGITGTYNSTTGVLTLSGAASVANYRTALRSVTFSLTSQNPSTTTRAVSFQSTDSSGAASNTATRDIAVTAAGNPPIVTTSAGSTAYTEGAAATAVDAGLTTSDPDSANLASARVRISSGFESGDQLALTRQNGITGSYNAATGVLTLRGSATKANYQAALRSVTYRTTSDNPALSKTAEFSVNDGALDSAAATKTLSIARVNDAPAVTTSAGQAGYQAGASPVQADPALDVDDPDSAQLKGATVRITTNFTAADGDTLSFTSQNGITGTYNSTTGVLTLSGAASVANYRTALRSVTFSVTTRTPSTATRTVSFQVTDANGAASNAATRGVTVAAGATDPLDAIVAHDLTFAAAQLRRTLAETAPDEYPQETRSDGTWTTYSAQRWTSGFFPGSLWQMYEATGDSAWRTAAQARQAGLEGEKTDTGTDDIGFILLDSFGKGYRLTGTDSYRQVVLTAARTLLSRYSSVVGALRSLDNPAGASTTDFRVIVDSMMNSEMLYWASAHGGDPGLANAAVQHAVTTMNAHVRPDGSTYHMVVFDSTTGAVKRKQTIQGYNDNSTWSRGQAWTLYGFTMAYRETGNAQMLATARRVADYYIAHLPSDNVPYWDFQAPGIPNEPRDSSAAAIAASGLLELSQLETDATRKQRYLSTAKATLTSLSSSSYLAEGTNSRSILLHGTADEPIGHTDRGLIYGDYFFIEALVRYRAMPK